MPLWPTVNGSEGSVAFLKRVGSSTARGSGTFLQRAITTLVLGPLALWLIYKGGLFYFIPLVLILSFATLEYATLLSHLGWRLPLWLLLPAVLLQAVAAQWPDLGLMAPALVVTLLAMMLYVLWLYERRRASMVPADWAGLVMGVVLIGWVGGHFFRLRGMGGEAMLWTMLAMLSTWIADSAAYVVGKRLGRRKLAVRLSPNKTVEGYVGGIVLGTLLTIAIAMAMGLPWMTATILGLLASAVSLAGDLGISLLKREAGVKDSGRLLPGHGGALDRIDSLMWSVTMAYYVVTFLT
jgi:phosphatidate cytidylyltransferase